MTHPNFVKMKKYLNDLSLSYAPSVGQWLHPECTPKEPGTPEGSARLSK